MHVGEILDYYPALHDYERYFDDDEELLKEKLDPVGSTVRYEVMKLCTGSV